MLKNQSTPTQYLEIDWDNIQGPVAVPLTNDYLFRALLQRNNRVLKALICSLLHLKISDVHSVIITNPIELGKAINDKEFILDIRVELNQNTVITYWMTNEKTHQMYSDKLRLSVLDLNCINLATEDDKHYKIDHWASLFKSTTWEELKMLAKSDKYIQEAANSVYELTQDEKIRQQCEAREDYRRRTVGRERMLKEALEEKQKLAEENQQLSEENQLLFEEKQQLSDEIIRLHQLLLVNGIDAE